MILANLAKGDSDLSQVLVRDDVIFLPDGTWDFQPCSAHVLFYSKAQRPDPHSDRPQPKLGAPEVLHTGREFERAE
jgi:hypothetical protein